jgi:hypothetical protein
LFEVREKTFKVVVAMNSANRRLLGLEGAWAESG